MKKISDLTFDQYRGLGLATSSRSRKLREAVGVKLGIGYANGKQFYKRLVMFGIGFSELRQTVSEVENGK